MPGNRHPPPLPRARPGRSGGDIPGAFEDAEPLARTRVPARGGAHPGFDELDRNRDGAISPSEFASFYDD